MLVSNNWTIITRKTYILFRPAPGREYVETYIKAFYLSESELETWLQEHQVFVVSPFLQ